MKWYFLMMVAAFFAMASVEIFAPNNRETKECTYIRSEELINPTLVITVGIDSIRNDTDYIYRIQ